RPHAQPEDVNGHHPANAQDPQYVQTVVAWRPGAFRALDLHRQFSCGGTAHPAAEPFVPGSDGAAPCAISRAAAAGDWLRLTSSRATLRDSLVKVVSMCR